LGLLVERDTENLDEVAATKRRTPSAVSALDSSHRFSKRRRSFGAPPLSWCRPCSREKLC
jgi:hypothetical protein